MARKSAIPESGAGPKRGRKKTDRLKTNPEGIQQGPSEATVRAFLDGVVSRYDTWQNKLAELEPYKEEAKTAQAEYRNHCKQAKNAGLDEDAISDALKLRKQDPEAAALRMKKALEYASYIGLDVGTQLSMLGDDGRPQPGKLALAFGRGYEAGQSNAGTIDDNEYDANSKDTSERGRASAFEAGYVQGQKDIADKAFRGGRSEAPATH